MKVGKLFLMVCIMAFWSCRNEVFVGEEEPATRITGYSALGEIGIIEVSDSEFFMMQIAPSIVSAHSKNKFIVVNHTTYELYWNTAFTLEYLQKNQWTSVPITGDWINIGYVLYPGEIFSNETIVGKKTLFKLIEEFNLGKKGRYRITHKVSIPDIGKYDSCIEFELI